MPKWIEWNWLWESLKKLSVMWRLSKSFMNFFLLLPFTFDIELVHSRSKCLVWVKKCCQICLDQNFDPSLLSKKLWPFYMRMKQKKFFFSKIKFQNGRLKKSLFSKIANSQKIFAKISWIGPWVSRIEWCEAHWYGSTYMTLRLSNISSKRA